MIHPLRLHNASIYQDQEACEFKMRHLYVVSKGTSRAIKIWNFSHYQPQKIRRANEKLRTFIEILGMGAA